jgi:serine/threonine protein kinase
MPPGRELIEHQPQRKHVCSTPDVLPARLLGRHVAKRAKQRVPLSARPRLGRRLPHDIADQARQTEIQHLHVSVGPQHDVLRFDVPVNDPRRVCDRQGARNLDADAWNGVDRQLATKLTERAAGNELHHDESPLRGFTDLVQGDDVWMVQRRGGLRLPTKSVHGIGRRVVSMRDQLQRDFALEASVAYAIDFAHAAGANSAPISYGRFVDPRRATLARPFLDESHEAFGGSLRRASIEWSTLRMVGSTVSHYRILEKLGSGGMGVVFRAEDTILHRQIALKFLSPATSTNPQAVERFLREARAAAALNHPNICTIYEIGQHGEQWYIAMEALDGDTLQRAANAGAMPIDRVLDLAIQLADGLSAAHSRGIVHRDIKPSNLFLTIDGRLKILDFGLAKFRSAFDPLAIEAETMAGGAPPQLTGGDSVVGTVSYMSPEQARGETIDGRTDLFSFGVVLYELCTGDRPFGGKTSAVIFHGILSQTPARLRQHRSDAPVELEAIIAKMLEKDPQRRYQSASDVATDLRGLKRRLDAAALTPGEDSSPSNISASSGSWVLPAGKPEWVFDFLRRFERAGGGQHVNPHQYVWPAATMQEATSGEEVSTQHLGELLRSVVRQDHTAVVLLLGDYGAGKTSFLRMFGRELARELLAGTADALIPVYLNLGFARNRPDFLQAIADYVARYGVSASREQWTDLLLNEPTVLLLDGFDELAGWMDYRQIPELLERIRGLQVGPDVRIVLSGRSSFFRSDIEVGVVGAQYVAKLSPFDVDGMVDYVRRRAPDLAAKAAQVFERNPHVRELCRNPIHLMLFVNWLSAGDSPLRRSAMDSGTHVSAAAADLSVVDLYRRFFMKTLQDNVGALTRWSLEQRWDFVRRIAWDWFKERTFDWPLQEFSRRIAAELPDLPREEIEAYTLQLLNSTFFVRTGDRYRYLHLSYVEFLVSELLCDALLTGDLSKWDTPLYTDIYEMTYQLLSKRGLANVPVDWIMETGGVRVQGNFMAMSWRHHPPEMEPHLRKQLRQNPNEIVRFLAAMGIGLYAPTAENIGCIDDVFRTDANSVVRAMIQRVASCWRKDVTDPALSETLEKVVDADVALGEEDGRRATIQHLGSPIDAERAAFAFRRAMIQGDSLWTAAIGGMLGLAISRHTSSFTYIYNMAARAKHPEIRNAYRAVQSFTGLPDLPPL